MTEHSANNYEKILNYIKIIQRKPKKDIKFFYFDDGIKFIVDGNRLKLLPLNLHKYYTKDEFYVHVNPQEKKIMFYAYNINNYLEEKHIDEDEGYIEWDEIEDCIYNFFVLNIKELADSATPYIDVQEPNKPATNSHISQSTYTPYTNTNNYNNYGYGSTAYKEREAFFDKLWDLLKKNRSAQAMDHISNQIGKMREDKKFEDLDCMFRIISFDKLSIPTMLGLLSETNAIDTELKNRKDFFDKVKNHIAKVKPSRVAQMLNKLSPAGNKLETPTYNNATIVKYDTRAN